MEEKEKIKKDEIKKEALRKLNEYVKGELKYLVDNNLSIDSFSLENMLDDYLTNEERKEVSSNLKQLIEGHVVDYCKTNGIDIPNQLLKNNRTMANNSDDPNKESEKKEKELLISDKPLKPGQKVL